MHHHTSCSALIEKVLLLLLVLLQCAFTNSYSKYDCFVTIRHRDTPPDEMVKYVKENAQLNADIVNSDPIKTCPLGDAGFWEKNLLGKNKKFYGCHNFRCLDGNGNDIFVISACYDGNKCDRKFEDFCREAGGRPNCKDCVDQIQLVGSFYPCNKEFKELNKIPDIPNGETTTTTDDEQQRTTSANLPGMFV